MSIFDIYWAPEGRRIATAEAQDHKAAIRKAPQPYRKYLGEIYAIVVMDESQACAAIPSQCHRHQGRCK